MRSNGGDDDKILAIFIEESRAYREVIEPGLLTVEENGVDTDCCDRAST